jgi:ubiquinone/menaquinone biosynthesis C-methylase UbiE
MNGYPSGQLNQTGARHNVALYDKYADWYEEFVTSGGARDYSARVATVLTDLLGPGPGVCLDVCCGTGVRAATLKKLGWHPVGVDLSANQLRHATGRLPVANADATALPIATESVDAAICVLGHTDVPDYAAVVREAVRTLRPGGTFVHIGVHPCFCGYHADWSDRQRVLLTPGYNTPKRSYSTWSPDGVRARVGAWHLPLHGLITALLSAGLRITGLTEAGPEELPDLLGIAAIRPT